MSIAKITVLGSGFRGLWLAQELVKNKFDVTWLSLDSNVENFQNKYPWQMGSEKSFNALNDSQKEFINQIFKIKKQIGFQIITKDQFIDLSPQLSEKSFELFFRSTTELLYGLFKAWHMNDKKLVEAFKTKLSTKAPYTKWVLNIVEQLRGEMLDIHAPQLLPENHYEEDLDVAVNRAAKNGVNVLLKAKINDIAKDGHRITGIEIQDSNAFRPCDQLVLSCSTQLLQKKLPQVSDKFKFISTNIIEPFKVWLPITFKMKAQSRPAGLEEFFSYVYDPMMPFEGTQCGLARWQSTSKGDLLSIWCLVPFEETKKQSYYKQVQNEVKNYLDHVFESFSECFSDFETHPIELVPEKTQLIYQNKNTIKKGLFKKNLWLGGEETDEGMELFSILKTEENILKQILKHYSKEINRDRKIHASSDGKPMAAANQI